MSWKVEGTYMESCSCDAICPCIVLNTPTKGSCSALVGWQIDKGSDGDVDLAGLKVGLLLFSPGKMHETPWDVAVFLDNTATPEQRESLLKIYGGKAGGHPEVLASLMGNILAVNDAKIDFEQDGDKVICRIENVGHAEMVPIEGQGGEKVTVHAHPFAPAPGYDALIGNSADTKVKFGEWDWDFTGQQCMSSPFMYENADA